MRSSLWDDALKTYDAEAGSIVTAPSEPSGTGCGSDDGDLDHIPWRSLQWLLAVFICAFLMEHFHAALENTDTKLSVSFVNLLQFSAVFGLPPLRAASLDTAIRYVLSPWQGLAQEHSGLPVPW